MCIRYLLYLFRVELDINMKKVIWLFLPFLITACNFPLTRNITPTPNVTQAYQTVMAQVSTMEAAGTMVTPLSTPVPGETQTIPTLVIQTLPAQTAKPLPTSLPTQVCDRVLPGNPIDITIPDDSTLPAESSFTKTWRLENGGSCTWSREYSIVWVAGEQMTENTSYRMTHEVLPNHTIDISLDMTAPASVGNYQSYWMLQNADGLYFGIGPTGKSPFWVKIVVQAALTPSPTPTATYTAIPNHALIYTGISSLNKDQSIDITNGTVADGGNLDMAFTGSMLKGVNSASLSTIMSNQPNYANCQAQDISNSQIEINNESLYKYLCVKDNQNNIGSIQILAINSGNSITIEMNTWSSN